MKFIGHGIDILSLNRPELSDYHLAKRFMTRNEYERGIHLQPFQQHLYVCGIWSLKEAIIKATNHKFLFSEIEIQILDQKAPHCELKNNRLLLSLSYEKEYVFASAIAYQD